MIQAMKATCRRPAVLIAVCWFLLHLPLLLGFRVLPGDAMSEFYPMVHFNVHSLRQGMAPWWNPMIFSGYPQIADPQAMLFSPLIMAWMLLREDPGTTWFAWAALLHVLAGGWAFAALVRRMGASEAGAVIGTLVFMTGGVAASRVQYVPIHVVYCLLPLALLVIRRFLERPGWRRGAVLGLVAAAMLVQPVQLTYLAGLGLAGYLAAVVLQRVPGWTPGERWQALAGLGVAALLCVLLALPQLALSYAFVSVSNRPVISLQAATALSIDVRSLLTFVSPNALQSLRGTYNGPIDPIETYFYIGALPTLLLLGGLPLLWIRGRYRSTLPWIALMGVASVVYALGSHTPVFAWLHTHVPGVDMFRRPSDSLYFLNLALALAVALATSHIDLSHVAVRRWLFGLASLWLIASSAEMAGDGEGWQAASLLVVMTCLAVFAMAKKPRSTQWALHAICIVTVVDYRCFNANGEFNQRRDLGASMRGNEAAVFLAAAQRSHGSHMLAARSEAIGFGASWKNLPMLHGVNSTQGYGPLRWTLYDRWYGAYGDGNGPRPRSPFNTGPSSALNALLGVSHVVQPIDYPSVSVGQRVFHDAHAEVWFNALALPRVLTPSASRVVSLEEIVTPDAFAATDFRTTVWLTPRDSEDRIAAMDAAATCHQGTSITRAASTHASVTISSQGDAAGWLVLSDKDFPGWIATIDGREVPFHRANGLFRALCVPAGTHETRFVFSPLRMVRDVFQKRASWI